MRQRAFRGARVLFACAVLGVALGTGVVAAATAQERPVPALYVLGGTGAVSDELVARFERVAGTKAVRLAGVDRYDTAAAVSRAHFDGAPAVVIASGESFADALSAGPAATRLGGPILLATRTALPPSTEAELDRLRPDAVVIAGGPAAIGPAVEARLAALGTRVRRVSGPDRYATSAALARLAAPTGADIVFLASGRDYADALSGAAPAAVHDGPILLVDPDGAADVVLAEAARLTPEDLVVLGGEGVVPSRVAEQVAGRTGAPWRRVAGSDRFATNARVSATFYPQGADAIYIANGGRFADAMVVGAVARGTGASAVLAGHRDSSRTDGVLLYTADLHLPDEVEREMARLEQSYEDTTGEEEPPSESPSPLPSPLPSPEGKEDDDDNGGGGPANVAPVAVDDDGVDFTTDEDTSFTTPALTLNDTDADGGTLSVTAIDTTGVDGDVTLNPDGTLDYDPDAAFDALSPGESDTEVIGYTLSDGQGGQDTGAVTITLDGVNDAPVVDLNGAVAGLDLTGERFTEGGAAIAVAPDATVSDPEGDSLTGLTLTLVNRPDGASEGLDGSAVPVGPVTAGAYDPDAGTLALTGTASASAYETALRAVTYGNVAADPDGTDRVVRVTATDGDVSAARTSTIDMETINDAPTVDLNGGDLNVDVLRDFVEDAGAVLIAPDAVVSDADSSVLDRVTVTLDILDTGSETLAVADTADVDATWDAATGVLLLDGDADATASDLEGILRAVTYVNTDDTPTTTAREIDVVVNDGAADSATATVTMSVTAANDAPTVDLDGGAAGNDATAGYTENGATAPIAPDALLSDPDSANLTGATITLTSRPDGGSEYLMATDDLPGGIVASYDNTDGVMSLSGNATVGSYQSALRLIGYGNTDDSPDVTARSITVTVTDGAAISDSHTSVVSITPTNDAPTLDLDGVGEGTDTTATFNSGGSAVAIAPLTLVGDVDGVLTGATVTISTGRLNDTDETLDVDDASVPLGVSESWNEDTGVLTLSGSASPADYQTALRAVTYDNNAGVVQAGARAVTVTVTDGTATTAIRTSTVTVADNVAPVAPDYTYEDDPASVFVNVMFVSGTRPANTPESEGTTTHALTLLDDASDANGDTLTVTDLDADPTKSATVWYDADTGSFAFEPTQAGTHELTYEISDGTLTDTGTVTIEVATDKVIFLKSGAAGDGKSTSPVGTLAAAQDAAGNGDTIFVSVGNGNDLTDGIVLEADQRLIGRPAGLTMTGSNGPVTVLAADANEAKPVIVNGSGAAVTLADGVTVAGVAVNQTVALRPGIVGTGGTATISGTSVTTTSGNAVDLVGGTFTLSDGVALSTTTGIALNQTSGNLTVSGDGNTLATTGGKALHVVTTAVTGGAVFESITANGTDTASSAITWSPSGATDELEVTGDTGDTSGGTVENYTGDAISVTAGDLTLSQMLIRNNDGRAISVTGARNLSLDTVEVRANGDAAGEHSVQLTDVTGTITIDAGYFYDSATSADLLRLENADTDVTLEVSGSTFEDLDDSGGAAGISILPTGTTAVTATVTGSTFRDLAEKALYWSTDGAGSSSLTFQGNTLVSNDAARPTHVVAEALSTTTSTVTIGGSLPGEANTFTSTGDNGAVELSATSGATMRATAKGNIVDSSIWFGFYVWVEGSGKVSASILDNTISGSGHSAVRVDQITSAGDSRMVATIRDNTISNTAVVNELEGSGAIDVYNDDRDGDTTCADIAGNSVSGSTGGVDVKLQTYDDGTPGTSGTISYEAAGTVATTAAHVRSNNPQADETDLSVTIDASGGAITNNDNVDCVLP